MSLDNKKKIARAKAKINRGLIHERIAVEASISVSRFALDFLQDNRMFQTVAAYSPIGSELDVMPTIQSLLEVGRKICLPLIIADQLPLKFKLWDGQGELVKGQFNILVPKVGSFVVPDVVFCPLLSYDNSGYRLGYGGGFYDRTIELFSEKKSTLILGCAYSQQKVEEMLPVNRFDKKLDGILTEKGLTFFKK